MTKVQFTIDSCRLVSISNYLTNSDKYFHRLIFAFFMKEQMHSDATFSTFEHKVCCENKVPFENAAECVWKMIDSSDSLGGGR